MVHHPEPPTVGFIGLGVMGGSMAGHVVAAGYPLVVYARRPEQAEPLVQKGAVRAASPAEVARRSSVTLTIVGYPANVESLYFGTGGLLENGAPDALFVDLTTSSPALAVRIAATARTLGKHALDAPVSGGDVGARAGTLSVMVGGDASDLERARPILECFGKTIVHQGAAGSGQHAKLANQIAIAGTMLGLCEALGYAERAGLDLERLLASISEGAAASSAMKNLAPRMLAGDDRPGFYVKHFLKDLALARDEADTRLAFDAPGLRLALARYEELARRGHGDHGTQSLFRLYSGEKSG